MDPRHVPQPAANGPFNPGIQTPPAVTPQWNTSGVTGGPVLSNGAWHHNNGSPVANLLFGQGAFFDLFGPNSGGAYPNWAIAFATTPQAGGDSGCLLRANILNNGGHPEFRQTPSTPLGASIYTDEHGEAQIAYAPGTEMYWNALALRDDAILNWGGGCDLQDADVIGKADITATAVSPYQSTFGPAPKTSKVLRKTVHSQFSKTLSWIRRGDGLENNAGQIVLAHAVDVDGTPFANEIVCFSYSERSASLHQFHGFLDITPSNADDDGNGIINDDVLIDTGGNIVDPAGTRMYFGFPGGVQNIFGTDQICTLTNAAGYAAVELINASGHDVHVTANFAEEGLLRSITIDPSRTDSGEDDGDSDPLVVTSTASDDRANATPSTSDDADPAALAAGTVQAPAAGEGPKKPLAKKTYLAFARVITLANGKRVVELRVDSGKAKAKIGIRMINGKKIVGRKVLVIRTNKVVRLTGVRVPAKAKTVKVRVVA